MFFSYIVIVYEPRLSCAAKGRPLKLKTLRISIVCYSLMSFRIINVKYVLFPVLFK